MLRLFMPDDLAQIAHVDHLPATGTIVEMVALVGYRPCSLPGIGGPRSDCFIIGCPVPLPHAPANHGRCRAFS